VIFAKRNQNFVFFTKILNLYSVLFLLVKFQALVVLLISILVKQTCINEIM